MAATLASSLAVSTKSLSSARSGFSGAVVSASQPAASVKVSGFQCRASAEEQEAVSRRAALTLVAGTAAALVVKTGPANAAYGEAANVFGKPPGNTDFIPYKGAGFSIDVPAKWNPSKEAGEYPGVVLRYEDNFDALCNLVVIEQPTSLNSVDGIGGGEGFLNKFNYLLGVQTFEKETVSEGGFDKNATIVANLLDQETVTKDGKTYLFLNVLTRSADGNEGGRHQLFSVAVSNGKLYIARLQAGDKRWFKGAKKFVEGAWKSFAVA